MDNLKTGDLILFCGHDSGFLKYFSEMIKYGTHSNYSHVGVILRDPKFIHPSLKGIYVWESGYEGTKDPQDGKIKLGVQITPLEQILKNFEGSVVITRSINCGLEHFSDEKLKKIHDIVYDKPYDIHPKDWIQALVGKDSHPQKIDRFWCSALVGYIYTQCGILEKTTDWSVLTPADFSLDGENLNFQKDCSLSNTEVRIK